MLIHACFSRGRKSNAPPRYPRLQIGRVRLAVAALLLTFVPASFLSAQEETKKVSFSDTWQGVISTKKEMRIVIKIEKANDSAYKAVVYSLDQTSDRIPVESVAVVGSTLHLSMASFGNLEGRLSGDHKTITGTWSAGSASVPLILTRATPETAWTLPVPAGSMKDMDAGDPIAIEAATIKPSRPNTPAKGFLIRMHRFQTINTSLNEMIAYAYDLHVKEVIGGEPWTVSERFDVVIQPEGTGQPSEAQWKNMLKKLLADRCKLASHSDEAMLPVYLLKTVSRSQKLAQSGGNPDGPPKFLFSKPGVLQAQNANMEDFVRIMQSYVLDRPMLDMTGISGRYDFFLRWTPDESQFGGMVRASSPSDGEDAPPALYTAITEQVGLKIESSRSSAKVLILDHAEKPSND